MKTAIIIHGIEGHAGIHWQKWLHDELAERHFNVIMPNMPNAMHPDRNEWLQLLKDLAKDIDPNKLILIGHSLGVATIFDYLELSSKIIDTVISVSGFVNDYGVALNSYFLREKEIDMEKVRSNIKNLFVIFGDNDPYVPQEKLQYVAKKVGVKPIIIKNGGHLNTESGFQKFPLLVKLIERTTLRK